MSDCVTRVKIVMADCSSRGRRSYVPDSQTHYPMVAEADNQERICHRPGVPEEESANDLRW